MDRGRLEAFSDGVMAVAITLLALNLTVAGPGHGSLLNQLYLHWPAFLGYLISFLHRRDRREAPQESLDAEQVCSPV